MPLSSAVLSSLALFKFTLSVFAFFPAFDVSNFQSFLSFALLCRNGIKSERSETECVATNIENQRKFRQKSFLFCTQKPFWERGKSFVSRF
jgi:hypothetical protein